MAKKIPEVIKKVVGIDFEEDLVETYEHSFTPTFDPVEECTLVRKIWAWIGVVSVVVIIPMLYVLHSQKLKIVALQAHVSVVSEMNAECFGNIIRMKK